MVLKKIHKNPQIFCLHAKCTVVYGRKVNNQSSACKVVIGRFLLFFSKQLQNICFVNKDKGVLSVTFLTVQ